VGCRSHSHHPACAEGISDCGSFEVWFADGRESQYFYWDDNPGRRSITRSLSSEEAERVEQKALGANPGLQPWP